jgi:hypothetical protein
MKVKDAGLPSLDAMLAVIRDRNLRFPSCPHFPSDLDIFELPDGLGYRVQGAELPVLLRGAGVGEAMKYLLRALNGARTVEMLIHDRPTELNSEMVLHSLILLHSRGLLLDGTDQAPAPIAVSPATSLHTQLLFWDRKVAATRSVRSGSEVMDRLARCRVAVVGSGYFGTAACNLHDASRMGIAPSLLFHVETRDSQVAMRTIGGAILGCDLVVLAARRVPSSLVNLLDEHMHSLKVPWLRGVDDGCHYDLGIWAP